MPGYELIIDSAEATQSLHSHLLHDNLDRVRVTTRSQPPSPGDLGAQEIITVLVTSGTGVAVARSVNTWVAGWIANQRRHVKVRIRRPDDDTVMELDASGPDTQRALERFLDEDHRGQ